MTSKFFHNKIFAALAMLCAILPLLAGSKHTAGSSDGNSSLLRHFTADAATATPSEADKRKAEYIFLEAQRQRFGQNDLASHFELLRHAHDIDPTNTAISNYLGQCMMLMDKPTQERYEAGLELMRSHCQSGEADYYENYIYASLLQKYKNDSTSLGEWKRMARMYPDKADVQFSLAESLVAAGDYRRAISTYDSLERSQGKMLTLTGRKLNVYVALRDTAGALAECRSLLATAPANVQYNLLISRVFSTFQLNDSALSYIDRAQAYDPDDGTIYLSRAQFYNTIGDSVNYDKQIYNALTSDNLDVESKLDVLLDYSRALIADKDSSERADRLFRVLIDEHPHEANIRELYSNYLYVRQDFKGAAEQISYALNQDPSNDANWRLLMACCLQCDDYPTAIQAGANAIKYNPDNYELYLYIGSCYYQMEQYDNAMQVYEKALEKMDTTEYEFRANIITGMGDIHYQRNDTARAFDCYDRALTIDPGNVGTMNNYAYFLSLAGTRLDKAEQMSAKTLQASPESSTYLDTYAWVLFRLTRYKDALTYIEKALANSKDAPSEEMFSHYGDILFMNGKPEEALAQWETALKLNPDNELLQRKVKHKTYFFK